MSAQHLRILLNSTDFSDAWNLESAFQAVLEVVGDQDRELRELRERVERLERRVGVDPSDDGFRFG